MTNSVKTPIRGMRWWRRHRFMHAYHILEREADRHKKAGHNTEFIAVNEALILLECHECPELLP